MSEQRRVGEGEPESAALTGGRSDADLSLLVENNAPAQSQTETSTLGEDIEFVEAFENVFLIDDMDATTAVSYKIIIVVLFFFVSDGNRSLGRKFDGVGDQVNHDQSELRFCQIEWGWVGR